MRPPGGEPYDEDVGLAASSTATSLSSNISGCLACILATVRACCCLPSRSGYAHSATSEQSALLGARYPQHQPIEAELEAASAHVAPSTQMTLEGRQLLPKGHPRAPCAEQRRNMKSSNKFS